MNRARAPALYLHRDLTLKISRRLTLLQRRIIEDCCKGNRAHYDLGLAREMQRSSGRGGGSGDYLVLHLSELVRVAFMAATSDADPLRLEGLQTLEVHNVTCYCSKSCSMWSIGDGGGDVIHGDIAPFFNYTTSIT